MDKLGVFNANQTSMCLDPYLNYGRGWRLKPSSKIFLLTIPWRYIFCGSLVLFMSCVFHAFASVHCCPVVTYWERAASWLLYVMFNCVCVTLTCGILDQVWNLIVSISDFFPAFCTYIRNRYNLVLRLTRDTIRESDKIQENIIRKKAKRCFPNR